MGKRAMETHHPGNRLRRFYGRFGFKRNSARGRYDMRGTWSRRPELKEVGLPVDFVYLGGVDDNEDPPLVHAQRIKYYPDEDYTHASLGIRGQHRWRYPVGSDRVFWWTPVLRQTKVAVDAYLAKRGYTNLKHVVMSDDPSQSPEEFCRSYRMQDVCHGRDNIPTRWWYKGHESLADSLLNEVYYTDVYPKG